MKHIHTFESFLNEAINESTINRFFPDVISKVDEIDTKLFKTLMPKTFDTTEEAMERIWSYEGNTMFVHYQYFVVKPNGNKPDRPTYRIHQSQYWLNDTQLRWQGRDPKESVNVTLISLYDVTDGQDKKLGKAYVDTKVFLDEYKRVFETIKTAS
jgi:hypothetical protein